MASCLQTYYAKDQDGNALPFEVYFDFYQNGTFYGTLSVRSGGRTDVMHKTGATYKIVAKTAVDGWTTPDAFEFTACSTQTIVYTEIVPDLPPAISAISWTPTGDYTTIAAGASLVESVVGGGTTQLMLVATNPAGILDPPLSDGEAILQIDTGDPFIVAPGDHFRFNNKEWWTLNIICGPECDLITIADETAEAEKIPKINDEITFAAAIDWHGQEMSTIKWYYAKSPGACFDDIWDLDWKEFARDTDMPTHTFDAEGDEAIAFFRISATNIDGANGEIDTLCGPIFNLWKPHPAWWDQLLEAVRKVNIEDIAHPIVMLSADIATMPGWTEPPFKCPICNQVFEAEDSEIDYAKHLMSHITAFEYGWFDK